MSVAILCYHKVGNASDETRKLNVEPSRFDSHVRFFARRQSPFFLGNELGQGQTEGVCFTFDDAYSSSVANAGDVLGRYGKRGTFYAVPALVGEASTWDGALARPLATWQELLDAQSAGHEIGNHTMHHVHLGEMPEDAQREEISLAHEALLGQGLHPGSFCYPYGSYSPATVGLLRERGYRVGLSLKKGVSSDSDDPLLLPRVVVAYGDSLPMLLYRLRVRPLLRRIGL